MEIFNKLKHLLTTSPIPTIVDPFKDIVLCTDACKEGLGGVLLQENYFNGMMMMTMMIMMKNDDEEEEEDDNDDDEDDDYDED